MVGLFVQGLTLAFFFTLLADLRYVGAFGRMVCRAPGRAWRLTLVLGTEVLFSTNSGMFHTLILWGFWSVGLWLYLADVSWRTILGAGAIALVLLPSLQGAKGALRREIWTDGGASRSTLDNAGIWLSSLGEHAVRTLTGNLDADSVNEMIVRYNQGWIVRQGHATRAAVRAVYARRDY